MSLRSTLVAVLAAGAFAATADAKPLFGPSEAREACRAAADAEAAPGLARAERRGLVRDAAEIRARVEARFAACIGWSGSPGAMPARADAVHDATVLGIGLDMTSLEVLEALRRAGYRNPARPAAALPEFALAAARPGVDVADRITQIRAISADGSTFLDIRLASETQDGTTRAVAISLTSRSDATARAALAGIEATLERRAGVEPWQLATRACAQGGAVQSFEYRSAPPIGGIEMAGTSVLRGRIASQCGGAASLVLERVGGVPVARDVAARGTRGLAY